MREWITKEHFHDLTRPLLKLPVSKTWRGYGSAIFFELGELTEHTRQRKDGSLRSATKGQATIMIEWSWRVERPKSVFFGSWSGNRKITNGLSKLEGLSVIDVMVESRLPELVVQLSSGIWVHSFTTVQSQPEWCLFLNEKGQSRKWIDSHNGKLRLTMREPKE
jgi:hypothetical protein